MSLGREVLRKAFHCLSLVYLAAYFALGWRASAWIIGAWTLAEGLFERWRLSDPALNARLIRFFGGIHRPKEESGMSGVFWTSLGCWLAVASFRSDARAVEAGILYLTFGDMAAAMAGKAWGRHVFELGGRRKSLEGTAACFLACLACGYAAGLDWPALWCGAATAAAVELLPLPFDDNIWLPILSGAVVRALS